VAQEIVISATIRTGPAPKSAAESIAARMLKATNSAEAPKIAAESADVAPQAPRIDSGLPTASPGNTDAIRSQR
jgi:hypothetical protein